MTKKKNNKKGQSFQLLVARGARENIDGHDYYMQLWLGLPDVDRTAMIEENCYFVYEKQGEKYRAVLGKLCVEHIHSIKKNENGGYANVAICRDTSDGKVQVDRLTCYSAHGLEGLILEVKGVFSPRAYPF